MKSEVRDDVGDVAAMNQGVHGVHVKGVNFRTNKPVEWSCHHKAWGQYAVKWILWVASLWFLKALYLPFLADWVRGMGPGNFLDGGSHPLQSFIFTLFFFLLLGMWIPLLIIGIVLWWLGENLRPFETFAWSDGLLWRVRGGLFIPRYASFQITGIGAQQESKHGSSIEVTAFQTRVGQTKPGRPKKLNVGPGDPKYLALLLELIQSGTSSSGEAVDA